MKTIKKIISFGFGALIVGATLTSAWAFNLSDYPNMFLDENNKFNGVFVVGADAKAEDVIGITNIATSLQTVAVTKTMTQIDESLSVKEGYELCNHNLYLGTAIAECEPSVDEADLDILADEIYHDAEGDNDNDEKYTQQILFSDTNTGNYIFLQDDNNAPFADNYLFIDNTQHYLYTYKLQFDSGVIIDSEEYEDDLEGTSLNIQGSTFVITDVKASGNKITQIEAQFGDNTIWMSEGEAITRTIDGIKHDIELVDVDADASSNKGSCGFKIDGTSVWVDVKNTETINGVSLGVTDAKRVNVQSQNQDVCKVTIGSGKITLVNNDEMKVNNEDVDGTYVNIDSETDGNDINWQGFSISWASNNEEIFMNIGDEYIDPMFGNFKFVFAGVETRGTENILFDVSNSDGEILFNNEDGTEVKLPLSASGSTQSEEATNESVYWGNEAPISSSANQDELIYLESEVCTGITNIVDCQGAMFLVVEPIKDEAHLVQINNIDINDNEINFDDLTYGTTDDDVSYIDEAESSIGLKSAGTIKLFINESAKTMTFTDIGSSDDAKIKTKNRAILKIVNTNTTTQIFEGLKFNEFDDGSLSEPDYVEDMFVQVVYDDEIDNNMEITNSVNILDSTYGYGFFDESNDEDDYQVFMTKKGSLITYDQKNNQYLNIEHPYDTAYAQVYISPTQANIEENVLITTEVHPISVSAVKLDNEIDEVEGQNIIAVGGACANSIVAELMNNPKECHNSMGLKSGQALIKLFENGEYVALVVAGQDAMDTRLASEIVANWQDYSLTGNEMIATTVSESSLEIEEKK